MISAQSQISFQTHYCYLVILTKSLQAEPMCLTLGLGLHIGTIQ